MNIILFLLLACMLLNDLNKFVIFFSFVAFVQRSWMKLWHVYNTVNINNTHSFGRGCISCCLLPLVKFTTTVHRVGIFMKVAFKEKDDPELQMSAGLYLVC